MARSRRFAAPGEWRTNVSLGGRSEPVAPPPLARTLAVSAAAAIGADLVGIDLLPTTTGYLISELNGAVDFRPEYSLDGGEWMVTLPTTKLSDSRELDYDLTLSNIPAGEHTIAVRVQDENENQAADKAVVR